MLHRTIFLLENRCAEASLPDAEQALTEYSALGLQTQIVLVKDGDDPVRAAAELNAAQEGTLCLTDSERILSALLSVGAAAAGVLHRENRRERFKGADYVLEEPQWLSLDSLQKVWQRQRHLPWTILETSRCLVREFTPEDLDGIYMLYDEEARRFLEAPSEDRKREDEILRAYIERIYRLYGYGQWAVLDKSGGELIGRMGYSFPTAPETALGADASFGFVLRRDFRHLGIGAEVGCALVQYGFDELGFCTVSAEAARENPASDALLRKLGFKCVELPAKAVSGDNDEAGHRFLYYVNLK